MLLTNNSSIKEVILFPQMKNVQVEGETQGTEQQGKK